MTKDEIVNITTDLESDGVGRGQAILIAVTMHQSDLLEELGKKLDQLIEIGNDYDA